MVVNYVPFAEAVIEIVVELYRATAKFPSVIHGHILQRIIYVCLLLKQFAVANLCCSGWVLVIVEFFIELFQQRTVST